MSKTLELFIEECYQSFQKIDIYIKSLKEKPGDIKILQEVYDMFHTIEGGAAMLGLKQIQALSHEISEVVQAAINEHLICSKTIMDVVFEMIYKINKLLGQTETAIKNNEPVPYDRSVDSLLDKVKVIFEV